MKVLSTAEMQACDRVTSERFGVASFDLMRNAAGAVAGFVRLHFPDAKIITVLCGRGNNGGDGMVAARLLAQAGLRVTTLLLGDPAGLKGDAAQAWRELNSGEAAKGSIRFVNSASELEEHADLLAADLIVDAVLGTGFQPPMRGLPLDALHWFEKELKSNVNPPKILAVDLPSGWNADSTVATLDGPAYPADAVITFTAPKPAHVFGQLTRSLRDPIVVAPIGSPDEAVVSKLNLHWSGSSKSIADAERSADSNKGMYGHVLVIGGSQGKSGAPAMAALSALRTGAGLVTAAVTPSVLPLVAGITPELMTQALITTAKGKISTKNLEQQHLSALLKGITVLALGPGLGTSPEAGRFTLGLLRATSLPTVADADALNILAENRDQIAKVTKGRTFVLTPHPGEMGRLAGLSTKEIQADRIRIAREFAQQHDVILVLKGWRTLIAHPDGAIAVNTTGNPGMAKGGSGDLLTGMVAAMLAQHPNDAARAVEAAVYLHGLAADITVRSSGIGGDQHTLLATDSLANLHRAFRYHPSSICRQTNSGYAWLQGLAPEVHQ